MAGSDMRGNVVMAFDAEFSDSIAKRMAAVYADAANPIIRQLARLHGAWVAELTNRLTRKADDRETAINMGTMRFCLESIRNIPPAIWTVWCEVDQAEFCDKYTDLVFSVFNDESDTRDSQ